MAVKKNTVELSEQEILAINENMLDVYVIGKTPLIFNSMNAKIMQELLLPGKKKTAHDKATKLKHDPMAEFMVSPYKSMNPKDPTYLQGKASWFKQASAFAALDMDNMQRTKVARHMWIVGDMVPIYGIPQISCQVTRNSDINKTPDVRTRAILTEWAAKFTMTYNSPILNERIVSKLIAYGGMISGVGDFRPQKGKGNYGQYTLVGVNDKDLKRIMKDGGRKAQESAMKNPQPYDYETMELLQWFAKELDERGMKATPMDFVKGDIWSVGNFA